MSVYVVGVSSSVFAKHPDRTFRELAEEVVDSAFSDAQLEDGLAVDHIAFGNCAMGTWGQANIRGQVALSPLVSRGRLPAHTPIVNVEGGCATGSLAFQSAYHCVLSGHADLALAVGVEKTWVPHDPAQSFALFSGGIDQLHKDEWMTFFQEAGRSSGHGFEPDPRRIIFLDVHALMAKDHMSRYGTTSAHFAQIAAKNRAHAVGNPNAQFRVAMSPSEVLADRPVVEPFTRAMCAPLSDGAAAVLLASSSWLDDQPESVRLRALRIDASVMVGGRYRQLDEPSVVAAAAQKAYAAAGRQPSDIEVAEVHDATAFCELNHYECLGFCAKGEGAAFLQDKIPFQSGDLPVNLSGGLISKGHPLGATGLGMIQEIAAQLRHEGGARQAPRMPTVGLVQNAGGLVGFDEALCGVTILSR
ncbi:MAG: thiolase family protein [Myxococcota bacterium]|nr:thiolase family protein [Myxococcota bacterium]